VDKSMNILMINLLLSTFAFWIAAKLYERIEPRTILRTSAANEDPSNALRQPAEQYPRAIWG
jgi:hypothetical protein